MGPNKINLLDDSRERTGKRSFYLVRFFTVFSLVFAFGTIYLTSYYLDRINTFVSYETSRIEEERIKDETGQKPPRVALKDTLPEEPPALFDVKTEPVFLQDLNAWKIILAIFIASLAIMAIAHAFAHLASFVLQKREREHYHEQNFQ